MTDIGSSGIKSIGNGINTSGQITGQNGGDAFLYSGGIWTDLGALGGGFSVGHGINASGQVTGYSSPTQSGASRAFLYSAANVAQICGGVFS